MHILATVMQMKTNKELLSSLLKTTQMGQLGIRSVLDATLSPCLRQELTKQLHEYDTIETEAHTIATSRGWEVEELDPGAQMLARMMVKARLHGGGTNSKVADMVIQGNTKGMIKGLKNLHHSNLTDQQIHILSQKLLDCETANIQRLQPFL